MANNNTKNEANYHFDRLNQMKDEELFDRYIVALSATPEYEKAVKADASKYGEIFGTVFFNAIAATYDRKKDGKGGWKNKTLADISDTAAYEYLRDQLFDIEITELYLKGYRLNVNKIVEDVNIIVGAPNNESWYKPYKDRKTGREDPKYIPNEYKTIVDTVCNEYLYRAYKTLDTSDIF